MRTILICIIIIIILALLWFFVGGRNLLTQAHTMELKSTAFENNTMISGRYTCDGEGVNPPLSITGIPTNAKSLALVLYDPDAPIAAGFTHWIMWNIHIGSSELHIPEQTMPIGTQGKNSSGKTGYAPPCPPSGTHHYIFTVYAVNGDLSIPDGSSKAELEKALKGKTIDKAELAGLYERKTQ